MMRKIARALRPAKAQKARRFIKRSVKGARERLSGRTGLAVGAAVALPLAYLAIRSRQR